MRGSDKSNLAMFKAMCGQTSLSCVVLATTMWNNLDANTGVKRQQELSQSHWKSMIDAGSKIVRHDDNRASALRIIDMVMERQTLVELDIQHQLITEQLPVEETNAGRELKTKVINAREKAEARLRETQSDLQKALDTNNENKAKEALEEQAKYEAQIKAKDAELEKMKANMETLFEQKMEEMRREKLEREHRRIQDEAKLEEMKQDLQRIQTRQKDLESGSAPPAYNELAFAASKNDLLQLQVKDLEQKMQVSAFQEKHRMEQQAVERQRWMEVQASGSKPDQMQMMQYLQEMQRDAVAATRFESSQRVAKKAMVFGGAGAAAGAAALLCNVM